MHIGALIIGDEILSGKRLDRHQTFLMGTLARRGLQLDWVRLVGDDEDLLVRSFRETLSGGDLVFCFGGIGATPDDLTRPCFARAAGVELAHHPEAVALIEKRFGESAYPNRIRMAELPLGCALIPNPVNQVPGFSLRDHHCVPGFPNMAWPMVEWVLDTHYAHLASYVVRVEHLLVLHDAAESELVPLMEVMVERFPDVRLSSLPSSRIPRQIELGIRGVEARVAAATQWLERELSMRHVRWEHREVSGDDVPGSA
ncbi:competence/damage-inducible protein A [Thioalkalivibrio denitrificans]|uniref:Competence/damage-inducible protein A n=1 Tax=Thioalkalivibrio denitrificans TaxID=108003 RepID=A0A1V3NGX9_9GAMM|nr:molybdopterin-binding protein [Thioalkalivibrio denitrificans]OOG24138.1 competence/damage-inducible protein A [Thioalkalivibrio denitrificans]